ncbi:hypothetical protein A2763_03405 [Candidatus Kaiserbacteria bacterium RIFCSPHIGHO2_01_FULL_54_36]|uniref:Uncharacterized protein n=1 Tax=Candidatus Kaiserbacteria bacterium RIFCSPHIGHO2_01_FULL_54_36 TaxID=1798482 RepID=A0A1F6CL28_9BACT|nr:MAG: hypothetical protein A2763_03405 [Candidatus Kaiserbacteria bacterium RIFCSPHIGHO2_01_FULL_54_36]
MGGRDKHSTVYLWILVSAFAFPLQNPLQKFSDFVFSEPPPRAKRAETPFPHTRRFAPRVFPATKLLLL